MGKRKVTILDSAAEAIASVAFFIEGKGLPVTAKRFVDSVFLFLENVSNGMVVHRECKYDNEWKLFGYKCVSFNKFVVVYLDQIDEIIVYDFVPAKMLK